jgi:hypothetical protein
MKVEGLYVCLSRSRRRKTIRVLRDLGDDVIKKLKAGPGEALRLDDRLLIQQDMETELAWQADSLLTYQR